VSTSSTPTIAFTGISQYASDYQAELNKAVQVAQIPLTQLQAQDTTVLSKETALGTLNSAVSALGTSLSSLGTLAANQALNATSSDPAAVSVTDTGATSAATYTVNSITSVATAASETSLSSYANATSTPVSSTGTMTLVVGSQNYTLNMTGNNNLAGLESQINALGAGVTASILTPSSGDYISVTANSTGATTLKLFDGTPGTGTNILTSSNQGANAVFQLNGINVSQASNTVNSVVPGVTFNILGTSASPVTLSLASDPTQLSSALQNFVTNYNALQTEIAGQIGTSGGALAGDTVINQIQTTLRQMTSYTTASGTVQSLADLGIEFSDTGVASLNQTTFDSLSPTQISDGFKYLGSTTTGFGGFSASLSQYSDPVTGLIQSETSGLKQQDQDLQNQISTLNTQISTMQTNLTAQLEAADAAQAELQNQQTTLTASLQGLSLVLYGRNLSQL
jgi:flagellar hook-associated protein 2